MFTGGGQGRRSSLPSAGAKKEGISNAPSDSAKTKRECFTFEPQQWRKSVCKNCFRTQDEHSAAPLNQATMAKPSPVNIKTPLDGTSLGEVSQGGKTTGWQSGSRKPDTGRRTTTGQKPGETGFHTAKEIALSSQREEKQVPQNLGGSPTSAIQGRTSSRLATNPQRSVEESKSQISPIPPFDRRASAPTTPAMETRAIAQATGTGVYSSASSIDARYVEELENDFFDLEDKYDNLLRERNELSLELDAKMRTIEELRASLEQYKDKINTLERRCSHFEDEIKIYRERLRLPESDQGEAVDLTALKASTAAGILDGECGDDLRQRLNEVEHLCQDVMEENEVLKEEIEEMQREIEEMHDHFQEEDRDSVREIQRDLDTATKTVRIFQFKLRKSERRFEQCEAERANLEERLARLESDMYSETDVNHIRTLEEELRVAKEVGVRLNGEIDVLEEKRNFLEGENMQLKDEIQVCQNRRITSENELDRLRLEFEKVKVESRFSETGPLQVTDRRAGRAKTEKSASMPREMPSEEHELKRELYTTKERETDLSEQLRFAEEEIRKLTRRITEAQADNEVLSRQIERFNLTQSSGSRGNSPRSISTFTKKGGDFSMQSAKERDPSKSDLETPGQNMVSSDAKLTSIESKTSFVAGNKSEEWDSPTTEERKLIVEKNRREDLKKSTKQFNRLAREFLLLNTGSKHPDWFTKYSEANECLREYESELSQLRKKMQEISSPGLYATQTINTEKRKKLCDSSTDLTKECLLRKVKEFEAELEDTGAELNAMKTSANTLRLQLRNANDQQVEYKLEVEGKERDLRLYIEELEQRDSIASGLLELMVERSELLNQEIHESNMKKKPPQSDRGDEESKIERLTQKMTNLEKLLETERKRSELLDQQMKSNRKDVLRPMISENERARLREIDVLKTHLEEKDEIIEDQESQLRDYKNRLERAKKMNDAMKTLVDKDSRENSSAKSMDAKQVEIEISSYRREVDSSRKELAILHQKLSQMEKVRDKLLTENKELQEELKLREDSLFDQDDELEKRNLELAKTKNALQVALKELDEARKEMSSAKLQGGDGETSKLGAQIAANESLKSELKKMSEEYEEISASLQAAQVEKMQAVERCKSLSDEITSIVEELRGKDTLLLDAKKEARKLDDELSLSRKQLNEANQNIKDLEKSLSDIRIRLQETEKESRLLSPLSKEASPGLPRSPGWRFDSSPDSGICVSDSGSRSRDGTLTRRAELERLRREASVLRQERDELAKEARRDKQLYEKRLAEALSNRKTSLTENSAVTVTSSSNGSSSGDLYGRAIAEKQMTTKVALLNEHVTRQNRSIMELKVQNESLQNKVLEYQRRFTNLKEQYDAEQETWLSDRMILESKAKEQEERKGIIASTRKSLQDVSIKLVEKEHFLEKERLQHSGEIEKLEAEKSELKTQLAQFTDQQKIPKVLQRFGGSSTRSNVVVSGLQTAAATANNSEMSMRLQIAEKTIAKLRSDMQNKIETSSLGAIASIKEAEACRLAAEQQMEFLKDQLAQMRLYQEQADLFRERILEVEQVADREYKVWADEREDLLCRVEEARINVEQWCLRLVNREANEYQAADDIVGEIMLEMERWRNSRLKCPSQQHRLLSPGMADSMTAGDFSYASTTLGRGTQSQTGNSGFSPMKRSISMEFSGKTNGQKGSTLSLFAYGMSPALLRSSGAGGDHTIPRCGRSVSPDVSIRKVSNYPDPTPGFLVRSRQASVDSLSSIGDVSQRPFNMPGKPPLRQPISPARRRFFDEDTTPSVRANTPPQIRLPASESELTIKNSADTENESDSTIRNTNSANQLSHESKPPRGSRDENKSAEGSPVPRKNDQSKDGIHEKKSSTQSVLSKLSSKLSSGLGKQEAAKPSEQTSIVSQSSSPEVKPTAEIGSTLAEASSLSSRKVSDPETGTGKISTTTPVKQIPITVDQLRKTPKPAAVPKATRSSSTSGIAPSIMLLRQKFGGK